MCDTFVALPSVTADGSVVFGKNSDREPNEAQALEYYPARCHTVPAKVQCTYLAVPQAKETYAILIGRPFWMWGAEMGANEKGVVIGNEAVWTRMPLTKTSGLTGMDLLRLALERSATATHALETLVDLLAEFGQGGLCGYEDKRMAYHNSFLIADPREAWVLETAADLWAAVKIKDYYSISNGLSIGEAFDESHPRLIENARQKVLKPDIQTLWATGTAAPCTSLFKPIWLGANGLPDCGPAPAGTYDVNTLWWHHEKLHRAVLVDYPTRLGYYAQQRDEQEKGWLAQAENIPASQPWELMQTAFRRARNQTGQWIEQVQSASAAQRVTWRYHRYWQGQNKRAGLYTGHRAPNRLK